MGRFRHSTRDERASSRSRHAKRLAAVVAFFVVGLTVSVALAAPNVIGVITGATGTDSTAAEPSTTSIGSTVADDPAATVGIPAATTAAFDTTALLTGTTATNEATATDGTAPAAPDNAATGTPGYSSLIVKLASGLSSSEQADVIARNGGTQTRAIAPLRLHVVEVPSDDADATLASYRADGQVASAELDKTREATAAPDDSAYDQQWSLPR